MNKVTNLIGSLRYGELKKAGIIPKQPMFTKVPKFGGSFPSMAKNVDKRWLGLHIDEFVHSVIKGENVDDDEYFSRLAGFITGCNLGPVIQEPEWIVGNVVGHPDVVCDDTIYDIKMTGRFTNMRISCIFQLLSYKALADRLYPGKFKHIGLILPAQMEIVKVDVSGWDSNEFFNLLSRKSAQRCELDDYDIVDFLQYKHVIGSHISRRSTLYKTFQECRGLPIQIFLGTRINNNKKYTDTDIAKSLGLVLDYDLRVYVHSHYTINLARADGVVGELKRLLETTRSFCGRGVVVHVGKRADMLEEDALNNMRANVLASIEYASEECPLLIETDSGGSLLDDPMELVAFCKSFSSRKLAICLDTCHVFAAGYDLMQTLTQEDVPIGLIHFNDSQFEFGSKLDRHASVGRGMIGVRRMTQVAKYACKRNIAMVTE